MKCIGLLLLNSLIGKTILHGELTRISFFFVILVCPTAHETRQFGKKQVFKHSVIKQITVN